jgi:hypothetical protein
MKKANQPWYSIWLKIVVINFVVEQAMMGILYKHSYIQRP